MERRYVFHPQEFAIDETERFYTKMAGSGWRLVKRGAYLSSFRRWAPEKIRYGIVLTVPARPGEPPFTEEQMDAYKASGWEYITGRGFITCSAHLGTAALRNHTRSQNRTQMQGKG